MLTPSITPDPFESVIEIVVPLAVKFVNVPAAGEAAPIVAPSIEPPLMSAVVTVPRSAHVPVTVVAFDSVIAAALKVTVSPLASPSVVLPVDDKVVKAPVPGVLAPMFVPSIVPLSMSTFDMSTSPVPFGVIAMFPSYVETIAFPLISKSPPN